MKNSALGIVIVATIVVASQPAWSGSLADVPTNFEANTPALADEVNANFDAIVTEVNDNNRRVASAQKAANGAQRTADNAASNANNALGRLTDVEDRIESNVFVSVNARAFDKENGIASDDALCILSKRENVRVGFFQRNDADSAGCDLIAGIQLPHNHEIKEVTCGQFAATTTATVTLSREKLGIGAPNRDLVAAVPAPAIAFGLSTESTTEIFAGTAFVDNSTFSYFLHVDIATDDFGPNGAGTLGGFRFTGCIVELEPPTL